MMMRQTVTIILIDIFKRTSSNPALSYCIWGNNFRKLSEFLTSNKKMKNVFFQISTKPYFGPCPLQNVTKFWPKAKFVIMLTCCVQSFMEIGATRSRDIVSQIDKSISQSKSLGKSTPKSKTLDKLTQKSKTLAQSHTPQKVRERTSISKFAQYFHIKICSIPAY